MSIKRKLILIVLVFSSLIIVLMGMNYFVMSTLSTVRAFVAGEAFYSKGQKDATYFLARYTATHRDEEYQLFLNNIKIPVGDKIARVELLKTDSDFNVVDAALIQARNEPSETRDVALLFKRFKNFHYFKQSIVYWTLGDDEVQKLIDLAEEIHKLIQTKKLTPELTASYLQKIDELNKNLTYLEEQYSNILGQGVRWATAMLFYVSFIIAIVGFFIVVYVTFKIAQEILKPIEALRMGTIRVEQGNLTTPIKITSSLDAKDELIQLAISFNKMTDSLIKSNSERDSALEKLEVRAKQLSEAQEIAHIGSWEVDVATKMINASDEFYRIFGLEPGSPLSVDKLHRMVHPSDLESFFGQLDKTLTHHDLFSLDYKIITLSGEVREVSQKGRPILSESNELIKVIGTTQDITERFKIQSQMIQSNKMASLGEMASGIAHEINNPLSIIKMAVFQMQRSIPPENITLKDSVLKIDSTVDRISKIIQGLRSFSRDGKHDPFELVSLDRMIENILSFCSERLIHRSIRLIKDDLNPNLKFEARPIEISQVLLNLLNNAIDAFDNLESVDKWIKISANNNVNYLEIRMTNNGPKIPLEIQSKIFQPFFTTKDIGKGTGLGLSLSITIIKSHCGEIYLDNASLNTCFVIKLPLLQNNT